MTVQVDGTDIGAIIEGAVWGGSVVGLLIIALLVYLLVRPPRHVRERRRAERDRGVAPRLADDEAGQLWRALDRMESRLEVLERALDDRLDRPTPGRREMPLEDELNPAADGRPMGREDLHHAR